MLVTACQSGETGGHGPVLSDAGIFSGGKEVGGFVPSPTDLVIEGNVLRYHEHELRILDRVETWTAAFGPPSRTEVDHNFQKETIAFVWDEMGIECDTNATPDGRAYVAGVNVYLVGNEDRSVEYDDQASDLYSPKRGFPGRVILEHALLASGWNYMEHALRDMRDIPPPRYCEESISDRFWSYVMHVEIPMPTFSMHVRQVPDASGAEIVADLNAVHGGKHCDQRFRRFGFGFGNEWWSP